MADYKLIYLARRNPALSAEEFPAAWRSHSRLASQFAASLGAHFRSVRQCVKVHDVDLPPAYRNDHDGCAILEMKSWDDLVAARSHPRSLQEMKADEARVFADFVDQWTLAAEAQVVRGASRGDHALLAFLTRRPDVEPAAFDAYLQDLGRDLVTDRAAQEAAGIMIDRVVDAAAAFDFAAVVELWFDTARAVAAAARDPALTTLLSAPAVAEVSKSLKLFARLNLEKQAEVAADGAAAWREKTA